MLKICSDLIELLPWVWCLPFLGHSVWMYVSIHAFIDCHNRLWNCLQAFQLGPTEASRYWVYWVPAQYVEAIKDAVLGNWQFFWLPLFVAKTISCWTDAVLPRWFKLTDCWRHLVTVGVEESFVLLLGKCSLFLAFCISAMCRCRSSGPVKLIPTLLLVYLFCKSLPILCRRKTLSIDLILPLACVKILNSVVHNASANRILWSAILWTEYKRILYRCL